MPKDSTLILDGPHLLLETRHRECAALMCDYFRNVPIDGTGAP